MSDMFWCYDDVVMWCFDAEMTSSGSVRIRRFQGKRITCELFKMNILNCIECIIYAFQRIVTKNKRACLGLPSGTRPLTISAKLAKNASQCRYNWLELQEISQLMWGMNSNRRNKIVSCCLKLHIILLVRAHFGLKSNRDILRCFRMHLYILMQRLDRDILRCFRKHVYITMWWHSHIGVARCRSRDWTHVIEIFVLHL